MEFLPIAAACAITGAVVFLLMRARMAVALAKERQQVAEARGLLQAQKQALEETVKSAGEIARRQALDEFLADMRVEERHYVRQHKVLFLTRKSLVMQERIYFRNIPLSNWIEHERVLEEGADVEEVAKSLSVLDPELMLGAVSGQRGKLLH